MTKCAICGKEFKPRNIRNIYCSSACNAESNHRKKREAAKRRREEAKNNPKPKEKPKKQKEKLSRDAADARERRMTYGIYMAYKKRGWLNAC